MVPVYLWASPATAYLPVSVYLSCSLPDSLRVRTPQLELADPVAVLRGAASEFVPLIPPQYRLVPRDGSSSPSSASSLQSSSGDTAAALRCQHRHSLERCRWP